MTTQLSIPFVETSSSGTSKLVSISASIEAISASVSSEVTIFVMSNTASNPVMEGVVLGTIVVGSGTGCNVGLAVTKVAQ